MNINRDNCEAFFLDFYEGRLEHDQAEALFAFLDENPDLRELFESYEQITLNDITITEIGFPAKESLKRFIDLPSNINEANCDEFFIAAAEGMLDAEGTKQLEAFLAAHPEQQEAYALYQQTRLQPEAIVFEGKAALKKTEETITVENCETYFVSAIEGLLTTAQTKELEAFLAAHPEQAGIFALYQQTRLTADTSVVFEGKAGLKKTAETITTDNCETYFISAIEGLLNAAQTKELETFLAAHPEQAAVFALYQQTRLTADTSVVYEDKAGLKRKDKGFVWMPVWRAAAAIAVLVICSVGIYSVIGRDEVSGTSLASARKAGSRTATAPVNSNQQPNEAQYANASQGTPVKKKNTNPAVNSNRPERNEEQLTAYTIPSHGVGQVQPVDGNDPEAINPEAISGYASAKQIDYKEYEYPTVTQLAGRWVKKELGVESNTTGQTGVNAMNASSEKMDGWDWASVAVKKVSKGKARFVTEKDMNGRSFSFTLGKFRYTHTAKQKK